MKPHVLLIFHFMPLLGWANPKISNALFSVYSSVVFGLVFYPKENALCEFKKLQSKKTKSPTTISMLALLSYICIPARQ